MNKKKILTTLSIAAVAILSGYGGMKAYQSHASINMSIFTEDIEALSKCESRDGYNMDKHCIKCEKETCRYVDFVADNCISNLV